MPKKIDLIIKETVPELKVLIRAQTKISKRNKLQALYLVRVKQCSYISEIAKLLHVNRKTVHEWFSIYQKHGLQELLENSRKKKSGRKSLIDDYIIEELRKLLEREYFQSYREIQFWLSNYHQVYVEDHVVYNLVYYRLRHPLARQIPKF